MKKIILLLPILIALFYSCGLLDSGSGMNPTEEAYVNRIYSININGENLKLLSEGTGFSFSQTEDTIFYLNNGSIYSMNIDGSNKHLITPTNFFVYDFHFTSNNKIYMNQYYEPYIINIDGSGLTKVTLPDSIKYLSGLIFSHSGKSIVVSYAGGIYLMNPDGTEPRLLLDSSNSRTYSDISFTPNDSAIIYIEDDHKTGALSLKLFNIVFSTDTTLFPEDGGNHIINYSISHWNTVLFVSTAGIHVLDLNTLKYVFLTKGSYPHYSNDGEEISYIILDNPGIYIYLIKSATIKHVDVNLPGNYLSDPVILPDNNQIIFKADSSYIVNNK